MVTTTVLCVRLDRHRAATRGAHRDRCRPQDNRHRRRVDRIRVPAAERVGVLRGIGERGVVTIATSGLFGHIAIDAASGHIVHIPHIGSSSVNHVNSDLDSFNRCVAAVITRFPFYAEGFEAVAEELRELISGIDATALAGDGFWETFCYDVAIGDYADWEA
ncbi:SUKH-4 family immunity protein [Streptomyces sp. NPDC046870]|uniref:SUKH-4 family immunity protein n=1 Tax=Streptomyces sp. NPDC046870 TaxID=3155135 RepID=UPI0034528991